MILSAQTIRAYCVISLRRLGLGRVPMIQPFHERTVVFGKTYGLSAAGYDVRIAEDVHLVNTMVLASTMEQFCMPNGVLGVVHDKSSWARRGVAVQNTVIEPGWRGYLTLELTNHSGEPIDIRAGSPIAQIIFHTLDYPTAQPYTGKYQDQQAGPQPAIMEEP